MDRTRSSLIVLIFIAAALAGCAAPTSEPGGDDASAAEPIQIGALLPLSGDGASYGSPALNGIQLAVSELNDGEGVDGRHIAVVQGDTRFPNTQEAVSSMERLVGEGIQFVIGATASDSSAAAKEIANEAEVILMSPGSTRPSLTGPGHGYFFRTIASDAVQGPQAAGYVFEDLGHNELVVMFEQTAYGTGLKDSFIEAYEGLGGSVVGDPMSWQHDEAIYEGRAAEAITRGTDLIWIAGQAPHIGNLIDAIRDQRYAGRIVCTEALENPSVFDVAGDSMDGVLFTKSGAGLGSAAAERFEEAYRARFGEAPGVFSAFAYDATYVAAASFHAVGAEDDAGSAIRAWLEDGNEITDRVTTDNIRFNSHGDVTTGGYALWEAVYEDGEGSFRPYSG